MSTVESPDDVVIVGAARTPFGKFKGTLAPLPATALGAAAIAGALERGGIVPESVDAAVVGHVLQAGAGQCPARQAAIGAGVGWRAHAVTVNKVCLSGLTAIIDATRLIRCGEACVVVAGGMESMTNAPYLLTSPRTGWAFGRTDYLVDSCDNDGLSDAWSHRAMGLDTETRSTDFPVSRERLDTIAARSHATAHAAATAALFDDEIVPITIRGRKGDAVMTADEGIRPDTTIERLARLSPAFDPAGSITAGNASQISDGAAVVVLTTRESARAHGWTILATVRACGQVAGPDPVLAPQPANAIGQALDRQGWNIDDVDVIEINEAFANVVAASLDMLGIDLKRVNQHGGAIALGHPIGASGARLAVHAAHELARRGHGRAAVALCGGTGQGEALLIER